MRQDPIARAGRTRSAGAPADPARALVCGGEDVHLDAFARMAGALQDTPRTPTAVDPIREPVVIDRRPEVVPDLRRLADRVMARLPDRVITRPGDAAPCQRYLERWHLRRDRSRPSTDAVYLHRLLRDDVPPAHDHPWGSASLVLAGCIEEHVLRRAGGWRVMRHRPGAIVLRSPFVTHMLKRPEGGPVVTLFVTSARVRDWEFRPEQEGR